MVYLYVNIHIGGFQGDLYLKSEGIHQSDSNPLVSSPDRAHLRKDGLP